MRLPASRVLLLPRLEPPPNLIGAPYAWTLGPVNAPLVLELGQVPNANARPTCKARPRREGTRAPT